LPYAPQNSGDPSGLPSTGDNPSGIGPYDPNNPYGGAPTDSFGSTTAPTDTGNTPTDSFGSQGDNPFSPPPPDTSGNTPFSDNNTQGFGGGYNPNTPAIPSPNTGGNYGNSGGAGDYTPSSSGGGGGYSGGGGYARGGPVAPAAIPPQRGGFANAPHQILQRAVQQNMAKGGGIPMGVSPSHGQNVDDVPARLNAGEFVVPRDVASWKGQEFFQNLIKKSRALSAGAPAKPSMKPPLPGQQQRPAIRPPGQ
jgi:hypothetical protein